MGQQPLQIEKLCDRMLYMKANTKLSVNRPLPRRVLTLRKFREDTKMKVKKTNGFMVMFGSIFLIVGLITILSGIGMFVSFLSFKSTAVETQAVITDIETSKTRSNGKTNISHTVFIAYTFEGMQYDNMLGYYSSGMREGQAIKIYVDPESPTNIRSNSLMAEILMIVVGLPFTILGMGFVVSTVRKAKVKKKLVRDGEKMIGFITGVVLDRSLRINGKHPYKAEVEVIDPMTGEKYLYSSEGILQDITWLTGESVTVYVDAADKSRYYVDIVAAMENTAATNRIHDYR